jgi:AcrR family transcriptional regulator
MAAKKLATNIRREQIAQIAARIISEKGVKHLNIAAIAEEAGIVPSAVYRHFKNKDEIIDAVLGQLRDRMLGNIQLSGEMTDTPLEQMRVLITLQLDMVKEIRTAPMILFSDEMTGGSAKRREKVYEIIIKMLAKIGEVISKGQARGEIRTDVDPETLAIMLVGVVQPAVMIWLLSGGVFDVKKYSKKAWNAYEKYLTAGIK